MPKLTRPLAAAKRRQVGRVQRLVRPQLGTLEKGCQQISSADRIAQSVFGFVGFRIVATLGITQPVFDCLYTVTSR